MCPECHRFICEESCPAHVGRGRAHLFCTRCDAPISGGEAFFSIGTRPFCAECLGEADVDDLQRLFKYPSRAALLEALGAAARVAFFEGECP